ncbi:MAG: 50S ribosomal protein L10 [Candidatus Paceibacterota bacterium]
MAISREKKVEIITKVKEAASKSKSVVFVNFHGLTVTQANQLRRSLAADDIGYVVVKKTLAKRALDELALTGPRPELTGEVALAYGDDQLAPVKGVHDFNRQAECLEIMGGIFDGAYVSREEMVALAEVPSLSVLYGQLANVINSPIQGLVIALNGIAESKA